MPWVKGKKPVGLMSIDVATIYKRLSMLAIGEVATYEELSAIIGRDVRDKAGWIVSNARRKCLNDDQIVLGVVTKIGLKRLSDAEIVETGQDVVSRIHNMTVKGARRLAAVKSYDALPKDKQNQFNTYTSLIGVLGHFTRAKQVNKVSEAAQKSSGQLPLAKMLEAFKDK